MKKINILKSGQIFLFLCLFSSLAIGQITPKIQKTTKTPKTPTVAPVEPIAPVNSNDGGIDENDSDIPFEKSIAVDSKVSVGFCVSEGNLKVNGWERDEVRVFVQGGSKAGFKVIKKGSENRPVWITIVGYEPEKDKRSNFDPCLSGETIEVDMPKTASIKIDGREATISIDSVHKVYVKNNEGNISISKVKDGIEAKTYEGDITAENSSGMVFLDTTNGNILAYQVGSDEFGDNFKAKTNSGTIVLQSVKHSSVEAYSISGSIKYSGDILTEGQYSFANTSGQIMLAIPQKTSCSFQITSQKGRFSSEMPLKEINENVFYPSMQKIVGKLGEGEANVNLLTQSGFIRIKKID